MASSLSEITAALTAAGSMFEIGEMPIRGINTRVWKNAPPNLRTVLEQSRVHGDKTFLVYEDEQLTFEEHFLAASRLATTMVDRWGVSSGDRVAIAMRNFPEWSIAFWAAAAIGAIVVPLNAWWKGEELEYGISDSGTSILFCDSTRSQLLAPHLGGLQLERVVVARPESPLAKGQINFDDAVAETTDASDLPTVTIEPEDDATIFYTSGTTGKPKGALGTQRNICTNIMSLAFVTARNAVRSGQDLTTLADRPQNAQLLSVPLFHATGCHSVLAANTAFGGKLVMLHKWDPERALEVIERERINSFGGVPAMVWQVLESPSFKDRDLSCVQNVSYGGAPAAPELVRRIQEAFPKVSPGNGYGLTETSSVTTFNSGEDYKSKPHSVGPAVPVCELKVVNETGDPVETDAVGELWIKGPNVVKGYWNKPEATAETFTDGWLHSGDLARIDNEGFVTIADRAKDMLIRGGENVYCVEVESVLYDHPDVMDAAVIGLPHRVLGEEVGAVVQMVDGSNVTEDELKAHVASRLAGFKVPVRIDLRTEPLPRNPAGKILKRELRDEVVGTKDDAVRTG